MSNDPPLWTMKNSLLDTAVRDLLMITLTLDIAGGLGLRGDTASAEIMIFLTQTPDQLPL